MGVAVACCSFYTERLIMFVVKKINRALAIDSPFQTFAVGLLINL